MESLKEMKYYLKDVDPNEQFSTNFILPVDLSEIGKFSMRYGGNKPPENVPKNSQDIEDIIYVAAGIQHNIAINRNGKVFSWGAYSNGRLGIPPKKNVQFTSNPSLVSVLFNETQEEGGIVEA